MSSLLLPVQSVHDQSRALRIRQYQLYAVHPWILARARTILIVVYTGNHAHAISVATADPAHPPDTTHAARPKPTPHGILYATSLAHFPSDYTIVPIPDGNFPDVSDRLYANIDLLLIRASRRTALTLDAPTDTTVDRFCSAYLLPVPPSLIVPAVLQLVKVIQASLAIFGMFPSAIYDDGLLCNYTVDAIHRWSRDIGGPCVGLEVSERIVDPAFVSGILSLVLSIRNKLAYLGFSVPCDPFLDPHAFALSITNYIHAATLQNIPTILSRDLIHNISSAYDNKIKPENRNVRRVLKHRRATPAHDSDPPQDSRHTEPPSSVQDTHILGGITSLAKGVRVAPTSHDPAALIAPTLDLPSLVAFLSAPPSSRDPKKHRKRNVSNDSSARSSPVVRDGPSTDPHHSLGVAASLNALWTGRFDDLASMRQAKSLPQPSKMKHRFPPSRTTSDLDDSYKDRRYDGSRSTEDESDARLSRELHSFGMWGGKMRSWAGLSKKRDQSVDFSSSSYINSKPSDTPQNHSSSNTPNQSHPHSPAPSNAKPSKLVIPSRPSNPRHASRSPTTTPAHSPVLAPIVFSATDGERYPEDDDLLSSGQVSPLSDYRPSPFHMLRSSNIKNTASLDSSTSNSNLGGGGGGLQDYENTIARLLSQKRPRTRLVSQTRVSSWSDPVSARGVEDEGEMLEESDISRGGFTDLDVKWKKREKARFHSLLSVVSAEGVLNEEPLEISEDEGELETDLGMSMDLEAGVTRGVRRRARFDWGRRWSFHDLDSFTRMEMLSLERLRMDVAICDQLLIMRRREPHFENVIKFANLISTALSQTSTSLRAHFESHQASLASLTSSSDVLAQLHLESAKTSKIQQASNTLQYEAEQFLVDDLWQATSPPRRKVFALRDKVFGQGTGAGAARRGGGPVRGFNRLQWTLDGRQRVVDRLGRTESEEAEERGVEDLAREMGLGAAFFGEPDVPAVEDAEGGEEDLGMKPMWLLKFFTSWVARFSAATAAAASAAKGTSSPAPEKDKEALAAHIKSD